MYSNHFALAVLVDGKPAAEKKGRHEVSVPFGAEYVIRLRNRHADKRALVKVFVDGENVSGNGYVLERDGHLDLERHHGKDRAFRFVPAESGEASEAGKDGPDPDGFKGTLEARFYPEKLPPKVEKEYVPYPLPDPLPDPWPWPVWPQRGPIYPPIYPPPPVWMATNAGSVVRSATPSHGLNMSAGGDGLRVTGDPAGHAMTCQTLAAGPGVTVKGGKTGQKFVTVDGFPVESEATVLTLTLVGFGETRPKRGPKKSSRLAELEAENLRLREQLAEKENRELKEKLKS